MLHASARGLAYPVQPARADAAVPMQLCTFAALPEVLGENSSIHGAVTL